jgi:hypothetical protein
MQQFEFVDNRRVLWFVGLLLLVVGLFAAFLVASSIGRTPGMGAPDIQPSKMGALPPQDAPKMPLHAQP